AIGWLTPQVVHSGQSAAVLAARQKVLDQAFQLRPQRFVRKPPQSPKLLDKVWINPPDLNKEPE
ncbi:MAG: IS3 family transposase, partial [Acidimicrobiia bacterium]|nr:IS3 family transposase [Acidimicrobiia bacterium]